MRAASPEEIHEPARIAIIRLSHLGDVVLALPLYHVLRERFPRAEIAWVVQSEFASLLEGLPGLARVLRFERRGRARAWLELRDQLAGFAPELAVDAQGNLKSAFATLASGANRRVGLARCDWRERLGARVLTERARPVELGREHALHKTIALCEHFEPHFELRRDPALTANELQHGRELVERFRCARGAIVQLAAPGDVRSWPVEHFERLARELAVREVDTLLLSGPGEETLGRELGARLAGVPRVRHWIGQRGLRELAALFTEAGRAQARFLGCDSGPMHLAAACGVRVVVLSGPQAHERTGPWPLVGPLDGPLSDATSESPHAVLRALDPPSCAPCLRRTCVHPSGNVCMSSITPEQVAAAVLA